MRDVESKRAAFRSLHESGCFVIPNPWDLGSALHLAHLGFRALATTSAGFAWSRGKADNQVTIDEALRHYEEIAAAVDVPLNADFEGGFAVEPAAVGAHVRRAIATGISGISVEDSTGDERAPLFEFDLAVDRVRAAAEAVRGSGVVLTARTEGFIVGRPELPETLRRLQAFAAAGADCLYAPGIRGAEQIAAVVKAVAPKPVNVLVGGPFASVAMLEELGVRRISVGGALARTAWRGFLAAAAEIARHGTFHSLGEATPFEQVNGLFGRRPG